MTGRVLAVGVGVEGDVVAALGLVELVLEDAFALVGKGGAPVAVDHLVAEVCGWEAEPADDVAELCVFEKISC